MSYLNVGQEYTTAEDEANVSKALRNYVIALEKDLDLFGGLEVTNVRDPRVKERNNRTPYVILGCVNKTCPFTASGRSTRTASGRLASSLCTKASTTRQDIEVVKSKRRQTEKQPSRRR